jgi:prepilin-type N-terminal cleavage/methylation domain-containing protein
VRISSKLKLTNGFTRRGGFTLIELLVVIAIIALLMSILMPALQRVKEQARSVKCLAHSRGWNLIFAMYVDDYGGKFPSGETWQGFWWIAQLEPKYQSYKANPLWFCPSSQKPIVDERGVSAQTYNIFNAWGIFTRRDHATLCEDGIAGSFGLNGYVLSTPTSTEQFEGGRSTTNNWRSPNVQGANNIPLFIESLRFDFWPLHTDAPAEFEFAAWQSTNHIARCCINRHKGYVNSSFCDFSARRVGLKELWTLKWHKTFNTAGPWTENGGVMPTDWPEWVRPFKDF